MPPRDNIRKALSWGNIPLWFYLLSLLAVWLLGESGVLWKYRESGREDVRIIIETAIKSKPIREEHAQLIDDMDQLCRGGNRDLRFRAKVNSFNALERQLAELERRPPMKYEFECSSDRLQLDESFKVEKR